MSAFADKFIDFFNSIGSLVCHQNPRKTLIIGGRLLPVCARCAGAYLGLLIAYMILLFRKREANGPPNLLTILLLSMPLEIDAVTQILGMRESTNSLRLITGLFFGVALLPFLLYVLQFTLAELNRPILSGILPKNPQMDLVRNPWITSKALFLGVLVCLLVFFSINSATQVSDPNLYWIAALPIVFSIIVHTFLLPILIFGFLIYNFLKRRGTHKTLRCDDSEHEGAGDGDSELLSQNLRCTF